MKVEYRILGKTTWGIAIDVDAEYLPNLADNDSVEFLAEGLHLNFGNAQDFLNPKQKQIFRNGLLWVVEKIQEQQDPVGHSVIFINQIDIVFTDYQEEGLFFAAAQWASAYFGFNMPGYFWEFDQSSDQYKFQIPGNEGSPFALDEIPPE